MNYHLFYFCDGIGSVFDSQVMALLEAINNKKIFTSVYLFLGINREEEKKKLLQRKISNEIRVVFYKSYPNYPFFNLMNRNNLKNALKTTGIEKDKVIFHTRGELIAWHLNMIFEHKPTKQILPDIRGASIQEVEEFYRISRLQKSLKRCNSTKSLKNLNNFSHITVVSESLKVYLIMENTVDIDKINVIPCLAGKKFRFDRQVRQEIRAELKLNDEDIVLVFSSGGTAMWQNNNVILKLAEKGLKVLNLSKKEIAHKNIINKFVSYNEMPKYLNSADAAIIWRDKSIVNEVASPVKFSEYVCVGLPVIANRNVDMISDYICKHECGILVDELEAIDLKTISELSKKDRRIIAEDGIKNFGIDAIVERYLQIYTSMNN